MKEMDAALSVFDTLRLTESVKLGVLRINNSMKKYDVIIIGGGHAGIEAVNSASKLGARVLLLTLDIDEIGKLSCNPAVGAVAKSHLVRETDILGGLIGRITDLTAVSYRVLNKSKGKAVWATRAQIDRFKYPQIARKFLEEKNNVDILQAKVEEVCVEKAKIKGVKVDYGEFIPADSVVVCAGTFLKSAIHIGMNSFPGGRLYEESSDDLFENLRGLGFQTKHFKTGTCARLDKRSLDFSKMTEQPSDPETKPFSFFTPKKNKSEMNCYITKTNQKTHEIIKNAFGRSPLFTGKIKAKGVRYCPSLEDKIIKFPDKDSHQIFIEPEGQNSIEVYPNGISTSLPFDVQEEFIHSIKGLEKADILRPGYGIEHGLIEARQLNPTLESNFIEGLFCAGQVNGTTGYEEAAAQGVIAGINAALKVKGEHLFVLKREESFIGLLIDDLVTKGTDEAYRMFTSRSEYRLVLREDNAVFRLYEKSFELGLIDKKTYEHIRKKCERIEKERKAMQDFKLFPNQETAQILKEKKGVFLKNAISAEKALKRPEFTYRDLLDLGYKGDLLNEDEINQLEIGIKYEGFIKRQLSQLEELKRLDRIKIPSDLDLEQVSGLSREIKEKLKANQPRTLREAMDISGVTPAAVMILINHLKSRSKK